MDKNISIIVPTYNERDNITALVEKVHSVLAGEDYEIVVIDDNSRDGTAELALSLSARYPVRVVVRRKERGLASAVVEGFKQSNSRIIGVMDADLQHPPETIPGLLKALEGGADIAIASRYVEGGKLPGWGLTRRLLSKGAIFLAHLLLPSTRQVGDPMSGFFVLQRQVVAQADLIPTGYKILLEVLALGRFQKITEVPYTFTSRSRGESKLGIRQELEYLKHIFSLMKRKGELARFGKFCLVGASGVVVNEGLLWLLRQFGGLPLALASAISVEAAIISNYTFNDYFTFRDRRLPGARPFLTRLVKFNLISLGGLGLNIGVLLLFTHAFGFHYLLANLCGIAVAILWNYFVNFWWTWQ